MNRLEFLAVLREMGTFTESEINLICSVVDYTSVTRTFVTRFSDRDFFEALKHKFRQSIAVNGDRAIMELAKDNLMMIIDRRQQHLFLMDQKTFQDRFDILARIVTQAVRLEHGEEKVRIVSPTNDNAILTYRLNHRLRRAGGIVDNIDVIGVGDVKVKSTFFFQSNGGSMNEWIFNYAMKLSERKLTLNLEDGLTLDIPSVV